MLVSWILGQKYYKIDYPLKKITFYFSLALALYFLNRNLNPESDILKASLSTILLISFLVVSIIVERKNLKAIIQQ